jgi:uncharacterized alpha/beta hydrolase family protein
MKIFLTIILTSFVVIIAMLILNYASFNGDIEKSKKKSNKAEK